MRSAAPIAVAERFLLVEDEKSAPFDRLRLTSSRDYRRPPEICAVVEPDGVTLSLDPARSDLLVEAELARFADLLPPTYTPSEDHRPGPERRQFLRHARIAAARNGPRNAPPPNSPSGTAGAPAAKSRPRYGSCSLAKASRIPALKAARMLVLNLPNPELLDGLLQHPATSPLLGRRLGPCSVVIADDRLPSLQKALKELGIDLQG